MTRTKTTLLMKRFGGFAASLLFSTVVSLLSIPVALRNFGAAIWAEIAVAMAIAAVFGVLVAFGWGTIGAAMTADTPSDQRPRLFANSLVSRVYLFVFALFPLMTVVWLLSRVDRPAATIGAVAYLIPFLGASWYFVGESKPWRLLLFDVVPQGLGTIIGLIASSIVREAWIFVTCQLVFNILAVSGSAFVILRAQDWAQARPGLGVGRAMQRLRRQWHGVVAAGTGTINSNVPVIAVSFVAANMLPVYVLADKLFRYAVAGFGPVLQVIQGWIPDGGPENKLRRVNTVSRVAPVLGLFGGVVLALVIPWGSRVLSASRVSVGWELSVAFGLIFCGVVVAQVIGLACLIPINKGQELARSTAFGAALNVVLMVCLGPTWGVVGIAWAVAVGELTVALYQILVVRRYFSKLRPNLERAVEG